MDIPLTSDDSTLAANESDDELKKYISTFVQTWEERQKRLTLNQAAVEKAKREWEAEQRRARQEARSRRLSEHVID